MNLFTKPIRAFEERDYDRLAAIGTAIEPEHAASAAWYRQRDESWDPKMLRERLVAERDAVVVAWGDIAHMWWMYHPRKFNLRLNVDPAFQQQGIGSALYTRLMERLEAWSPVLLRAETRETRLRSVDFLTRRGFLETQRRWESRVTVSRARLDRAADAYARLAAQQISVTTLAEEHQRRGEQILRDVFDLEQLTYLDEPGFDSESAISFDQFVANELQSAEAVEEGSFLALDGSRLVGIARVHRDNSAANDLHVSFTGVDPAYRGRGIALALKFRTIEYARANGFESMRTQNDTTNAAMIYINDLVGFQKEPPWLIFEKHFRGD